MKNYSSGLECDFYLLNVVQSYFYAKKLTLPSTFVMSFRSNPFGNGYTVISGIEPLIEKLENYHFNRDDLSYLKSLKNEDGSKMFAAEFLKYLKDLRLTCDIWAVNEGEILFPHEPVLKVSGNLGEAQLLETLILNSINYSSAVSTKAARIAVVAGGNELFEFGLRRAPSTDGGLIASRAAYIGGCSATSNLLAGATYSIPVKGTHSHSYVLSFDNEQDAFKTYAKYKKNGIIFLVDSYDTLTGVKNAINIAKNLANPKQQFIGIRIDSGDLAYLSKKARMILDEAGFNSTKIFASNNLDEYLIESLNLQAAQIDVWAVGTKLVINKESLSGVYKLTTLKDKTWRNVIKISNDTNKINIPGNIQTRRFYDSNGIFSADAIYDLNSPTPKHWRIISNHDPFLQYEINPGDVNQSQDLLQLTFKAGKRIKAPISLKNTRDYLQNNLKKLDIGIKRIVNPHSYPAGLEANLFKLRSHLIAKTKKMNIPL